MELFVLRKFPKEERQIFFQSKYEYYRSFNNRLITVSMLSCLAFFITDCELFGRFAYETVVPRGIIVLPYIVYVIIGKFKKNYKVMVPLSYLMLHMMIWFTCWSVYLLTDRRYAIPGIVIMNLMFVCAGFAAPLSYCVIGNFLIIADIVVANMFIHYEDLLIMFIFNLPCIIGSSIMHQRMQGIYLEQYLTRNKLEKIAVHDQLTEVYNRNILKEISDAKTGEFTMFADLDVSIMLIDIDFFKKVNDTYGHEAGDKVLVHLAKTLKSAVRASDYVIRWGGEEFLIIMPGCVGESSLIVAEKIRQLVANSDNGICKTTISIGVSIYQGGDYHLAIKTADDALYRAKTNGRNRVVLHEKMFSPFVSP